jgi:predicted ArsR family transcriptional regulator
METERIALSQRERDRLRVLHEVKRKQITQIEAARRLKISNRHVRRLLVGLRKLGDRAVLHGLRGRPSNRRFFYFALTPIGRCQSEGQCNVTRRTTFLVVCQKRARV